MTIFKNFFAPFGKFEPCGMFTFSHILSASVCTLTVAILLILRYKKIFKWGNKLIIRCSSITLTLLEIIKILHSFYYGDIYLDAWFPLSYCGLFIFALWMSGFGNRELETIGNAFIAYGCPFAGLAFLIFPTTSLMNFPIWHYFSLYSLFFHSLMIFVGVSVLLEEKKLSGSIYLRYVLFVVSFAIPAIIINTVYNSNLMNLREPYNIPINSIQELYTSSSFLYTLCVIISYWLIPFIVALFGKRLKNTN